MSSVSPPANKNSGATIETSMRYYPDLGVVVMSNVRGYQRDKIVEGLVSAWMHEK